MNISQSKYCYPDTNVLINNLGIKNPEKLYEVEKQIVSLKLLHLALYFNDFKFNKDHFKYIHKYIFEDIYPFAGNFRTENIAKNYFRFAEYSLIDSEIDKLFDKLKKENFLEGLDKKNLASRLAYYTAELNVLHPFREGNGRVIREFIRQLAFYNGYNLQYSKVSSEEILSSSIRSIVDTTNLSKVYYTCLVKLKNK